jgi:hypothetical protein
MKVPRHVSRWKTICFISDDNTRIHPWDLDDMGRHRAETQSQSRPSKQISRQANVPNRIPLQTIQIDVSAAATANDESIPTIDIDDLEPQPLVDFFGLGSPDQLRTFGDETFDFGEAPRWDEGISSFITQTWEN